MSLIELIIESQRKVLEEGCTPTQVYMSQTTVDLLRFEMETSGLYGIKPLTINGMEIKVDYTVNDGSIYLIGG